MGSEPVRLDNLISRLEMFIRQLNRKQMAELLGIPASRFSDLLNGKKGVRMALARKLYKLLAIPTDFSLEPAQIEG